MARRRNRGPSTAGRACESRVGERRSENTKAQSVLCEARGVSSATSFIRNQSAASASRNRMLACQSGSVGGQVMLAVFRKGKETGRRILRRSQDRDVTSYAPTRKLVSDQCSLPRNN